MKKVLKIVLSLLIILVLVLVIDFGYSFILETKPFIIISHSGDKYSSLLYDVYLCGGEYNIKSKFSDFDCPVSTDDDVKTEESSKIEIVDKSEDICADFMDYYYEDDDYYYYFTCAKSDSIYVIKDGNEYTIKYALNNGIVTMDELVEAGFEPLKEAKYSVSE